MDRPTVSGDEVQPRITRQWLPQGMTPPRGGAPARPGEALERVERIVVGDTGRRGLAAKAAAGDPGQAFGHFLVDDRAMIECVPAATSAVGRVEQARFFAEARAAAGDLVRKVHESSIFVSLCYGRDAEALNSKTDGRDELDTRKAYEQWIGLVAFLCRRFFPGADAVSKAMVTPASEPIHGAIRFPGRDDPGPALRAAGRDFNGFTKDIDAKLKKLKREGSRSPTLGKPDPGV